MVVRLLRYVVHEGEMQFTKQIWTSKMDLLDILHYRVRFLGISPTKATFVGMGGVWILRMGGYLPKIDLGWRREDRGAE